MKIEAIGLTGGIGSGKSTVAKVLKNLGYPVYIADTEASRLMNNHPGIRQDIISQFGNSVYNNEKYINKPLLAKIIFENPKALTAINHIVHPRVIEDFQQWSKEQTSDLVFFESAILFEAGLNPHFRHIICITASEVTRIQRVIERDHITTEQVKKRILNQMDDSEKCRYSDFIIYNDEDHKLLQQILDVIEKLTLNQ